MSIHDPDPSADTPPRAVRMGLLARAPADRLAALLPDLPPHGWLRPPETGTAMVQGRIGATGAPFNLGEVTVTRCSLRLPSGAVGHAFVQGRDKAHAARAAMVDALMQDTGAEGVEAAILAPLRAEEAARRQARAEKAAATRVEFFTMVRGED